VAAGWDRMELLPSSPPDDGQQMRPKHVEVVKRNKLRVNSASGCFHYKDSETELLLIGMSLDFANFWLLLRAIMRMNMSLGRWQNGNDWGKLKYVLRNSCFYYTNTCTNK
jgi:hypothetical protein